MDRQGSEPLQVGMRVILIIMRRLSGKQIPMLTFTSPPPRISPTQVFPSRGTPTDTCYFGEVDVDLFITIKASRITETSATHFHAMWQYRLQIYYSSEQRGRGNGFHELPMVWAPAADGVHMSAPVRAIPPLQ